MMKKCLLLLLIGSAALFLLSNCASITGFQDGRTVGEGNGDFYGSFNLSTSPNFDDWSNDSITVDVPTLTFPSLEFGGRYGVAEKVDLTLRLNTNLNLGIGTKFQLIGDRSSPFALALGAEVGSFGIVLGLLNVQIPLYMSVHPSENFGWYFTPRYIRQFSTFAGVQNGLTYFGANTGFLMGRRNKFGLDLGYYRLGGIEQSIPVVQFGLGGRFAFGKN
jgi:hypothetical protein